METHNDWVDLLYACGKARNEIGPQYERKNTAKARNYYGATGTTWLKYYTFQLAPQVNSELEEFLSDCCNKLDLLSEYSNNPKSYVTALKIPHPLTGSIGFLFNEEEQSSLDKNCHEISGILHRSEATKAYEVIESWRLNLSKSFIPNLVLHRIESFLGDSRDSQIFKLDSQ